MVHQNTHRPKNLGQKDGKILGQKKKDSKKEYLNHIVADCTVELDVSKEPDKYLGYHQIFKIWQILRISLALNAKVIIKHA